MFSIFKKYPAVGDLIQIVSFPRYRDGADAYAGLVGVVDTINTQAKSTIGKGYIVLRLPNGGWFIGNGIKRLKYKKLN